MVADLILRQARLAVARKMTVGEFEDLMTSMKTDLFRKRMRPDNAYLKNVLSHTLGHNKRQTSKPEKPDPKDTRWRSLLFDDRGMVAHDPRRGIRGTPLTSSTSKPTSSHSRTHKSSHRSRSPSPVRNERKTERPIGQCRMDESDKDDVLSRGSVESIDDLTKIDVTKSRDFKRFVEMRKRRHEPQTEEPATEDDGVEESKAERKRIKKIEKAERRERRRLRREAKEERQARKKRPRSSGSESESDSDARAKQKAK
eukprot:c17079_g1_i2.p1 GENE.c17079_g1_i2~~c17079_g1_i2.p1  ORF type:complete len:289 (+),score=30.21 c17079_g1_i2:101-868(+)